MLPQRASSGYAAGAKRNSPLACEDVYCPAARLRAIQQHVASHTRRPLTASRPNAGMTPRSFVDSADRKSITLDAASKRVGFAVVPAAQTTLL